jgi:integration host factor subunit beta
MVDGYMTKSELILRLARRKPHLYMSDVEQIVDVIFDQITAALIRGDRVELRGFGAFSVKRRKSRAGRNPSNGEIVHVPAKGLPHFRTGKALHDRLNGDDRRN